MTHDELQAIKARAEAATPGPWRVVYDGSSDWSIGPPPDPQGRSVANVWKSGWSDGNPPDAEFIAHARTDVPALVAEVERLRAALVDAWDAGFYHSAEGWNGEYPFNHPGRPSSEEAGRLRAARDRDLADM